MRRVGADRGFPMPATLALLAWGVGDLEGQGVVAGWGRAFDNEGGDVEQLTKVFTPGRVVGELSEAGSGAFENDLGVETFADGFGLAMLFEHGVGEVAPGKAQSPLVGLGFRDKRRDPGRCGAWVPIGEVHGFGLLAIGQELPGFVGGKGDERREHLTEAACEHVESGLGRAPTRRGGGIGVESIFDGVVVDGGEFDGSELADELVDAVEFRGLISGVDLTFKAIERIENPTVEPCHLIGADGVLGGVEIVEIRELIAQGITEEAIDFADLVDPFLADDDIAAIILGTDPEADDIGSVLFDVGFGGLRFFVAALALFTFRNFFTIGIDHEPVGEDGFEGGEVIAGEREEQGGLEPATMLIAAFEVHVRLPLAPALEFGASHENGAGGGTGVDPDVERVLGFGNRIGTRPGGGFDLLPEIGGRFFEPDIGTELVNQIGDIANHLDVEDWGGVGGVERGDGHAPGPLP